MKRVFWKVGSSDLELIGRISVGGTNIEIAADGDLAVGLVNGYRVVDGNLYENPVERIVPAMAPIIAKIFRDKWSEGSKITFFKKDWDSAGKYPSEQFMTSLKDALVSFLDEDNVVVEDEGSEAPGPLVGKEVVLNAASLLTNLKQYQVKIASTARYMERAVERAAVLSKRKLVASMWGG